MTRICAATDAIASVVLIRAVSRRFQLETEKCNLPKKCNDYT